MSRVSVHIFHASGHMDRIGEARNAHTFHMSIWKTLGMRHLGWKDDYAWFSDRVQLDKLWAMIKSLPREEGLVLAATYDRVWFPWSLLKETIKALDVIDPFASTAGEVANILLANDHETYHGFTFQSSFADSWYCHEHDQPHLLDFAKNICTLCGTTDVECATELIHA